MKSDCYKCAYRRDVPGSAHTRCAFDWQKSELSPPAGNEMGIRRGWYLFPLNYDPVWMAEPCPAFSEDADPDKTIEKLDPLSELIGIMGKRAFGFK